MRAPSLHVLAGPKGSGKTTFVERVLAPATGLPFVNADAIAAERWPGDEERRAYDASRAAAAARDDAIARRASLIAETVFSHPSKVGLVERAVAAGYLVELHAMLVPEDLAVARVEHRVGGGGHSVPEPKVRERYRRLWTLVAKASLLADEATFYDNSAGQPPFAIVARFARGRPLLTAWPAWTPAVLRDGLPRAGRR